MFDIGPIETSSGGFFHIGPIQFLSAEGGGGGPTSHDGSATITLPALAIALTGANQGFNSASASITLPSLEVAASGDVMNGTNDASGDITLPALTISVAGGNQGFNDCSATILLPSLEAAAEGTNTGEESSEINMDMFVSIEELGMSGPAPLQVSIDCTDTSSSFTNNMFFNGGWDINFGDPYSICAVDASSNHAIGTHVYPQAVEADIVARAWNPYDTSVSASITSSITVVDPDIWFDTSTYAFSPDGTFTGAFSGATQVTLESMNDIYNQYYQPGVRFQLERGKVFTQSANIQIEGDVSGGTLWHHLSHFGTGADPVVSSLGGFSQFFGVSWERIVFDGIFFDGNASATTNVVSIYDNQLSDSVALRWFHFHKCGVSGISNVAIGTSVEINFSISTSPVNEFQCISYPTLIGESGDHVFWGGRFNTIIGAHNVVPPTDTHCYRNTYSDRLYIHNNTIPQTIPSQGRQAIKMHHRNYADVSGGELNFGTGYGEYNVIDQNYMYGSGNWIATFGPQNGAIDERIRNVIFSRNTVAHGPPGIGVILPSCDDVRVRNNVYIITGTYGSPGYPINISQRWADLPSTAQPHPSGHVYHNNTCWVADPDPDGGWYVNFITNDEMADDVSAYNNLLADADGAGKVRINPGGSGFSNGFNLSSDEPHGMIDPENLDFRLSAGSDAIDAGTSAFPAVYDFAGNQRTLPYDIGAYEYVEDVSVTANDATGVVDLPALTISLVGNNLGFNDGSGNAVLPSLTITASATNFMPGSNDGSGNITLPSLTISVTGTNHGTNDASGIVELPALTITGTARNRVPYVIPPAPDITDSGATNKIIQDLVKDLKITIDVTIDPSI